MQPSILKLYTIWKSSISKVTFDIEGIIFDIGVARIQMPVEPLFLVFFSSALQWPTSAAESPP
jgi:hypothetical protein